METIITASGARRPVRNRNKWTQDRRGISGEVRLQRRDYIILQILDEYRYCRNNFLHKLREIRCDETTNYKAFLERIKLLKVFGYVRLPKAQERAGNFRESFDIYELTERGQEALYETEHRTRFSCPFKYGHVLTLNKKRRRYEDCFSHALGVCDKVADMEIGIAQVSHIRLMSMDEIYRRFPTFENDTRKSPFFIPVTIRDDNGSNREIDIEPDALVGFEYTFPEGKRYFGIVIEDNQQSEPLDARSLKRKSHRRELLTYKRVKARDRGGKTLHKKYWNFNNLAVLNVGVSNSHVDSLLDTHSRVVSRVGHKPYDVSADVKLTRFAG